MIAKDAKRRFAVYAPDFEAHTLHGKISSFKQSAPCSTAAFDQVWEDSDQQRAIGCEDLRASDAEGHDFAAMLQASELPGQIAPLSNGHRSGRDWGLVE